MMLYEASVMATMPNNFDAIKLDWGYFDPAIFNDNRAIKIASMVLNYVFPSLRSQFVKNDACILNKFFRESCPCAGCPLPLSEPPFDQDQADGKGSR